MSVFIYKAKKPNAETVTGQISAQNEEDAIELINQLGLLPVTVELKPSAASQSKSYKSGKVKSKELYFFSRQLSNLLKSGISLPRALRILENQTQNEFFKEVLAAIGAGIKNGRPFSECLLDYPRIFRPLFITLVRAGEESGRLQEMLVNAAVYQKRQGEITSKVKNALTYPVFMITVGIGSMYVLFNFVIPRMSGLFESIGEELPLPTQILLFISHLVHKMNLWILLFIFIIFFVFIKWVQSSKGKAAISRIILGMPLVGDIIMKVELARFCRTSVLLMQSGVRITRVLKVTIPILSNDLIKAELDQCREDLTEGGSFGESLKKSSHIPSMMGHLISVGEESGNLEDVLTEIADNYEQETDEAIKTMTTLLEPLFILIIGLVVGFIVFAMLLPIFQMDVLA